VNELGQLVMTGVSSTTLSDEEKNFLEKENIGGVILFSHNFESPAQLAELINSIQSCRNEYPLYIAVDNEGGRVFRFKDHFSQLPAALDISKLGSPKTCFHVSKIAAEELAACGINLNLAPVCDVWNNPKNKVIGDRAYGTDTETVSKFVSSVIRGFQTSNVLACAKHFPGHGCTTKDSHFDLPLVKKTMKELESEEFIPFEKAVKSRVEFIMMSHMIVDAFDQENPTTLSEKAYQILRDKLKYNKIIITDDMDMKAISDRYSIEDAAVKAIEAGATIIEYRDIENAKVALEALKEAKKVKKLKNSVINEKTSLVLKNKKTFLKDYKPIYIPDLQKVFNSKANQNFMEEIREKITEVKESSTD
jgi:beta-N-acetylhexosaminidase